ncbi:hypothetical protein D5086_029383 [Populus alba]|uniref:Uncharacterized protein n=1 Tax=Populus alba TaxID=43335 RepID=A0ACC4AUN6_POPAL
MGCFAGDEGDGEYEVVVVAALEKEAKGEARLIVRRNKTLLLRICLFLVSSCFPRNPKISHEIVTDD